MKQHIPIENEEQKDFVLWLRAMRIDHFAPMSENQGSFTNRKVAMIQQAKAKAMGKGEGVSDLFLFMPKCLLIIEMKRQKKKLKSGKLSNSHSKPSQDQIDFLEMAGSFPYAEVFVAYGAREAIEITKKFM